MWITTDILKTSSSRTKLSFFVIPQILFSPIQINTLLGTSFATTFRTLHPSTSTDETRISDNIINENGTPPVEKLL